MNKLNYLLLFAAFFAFTSCKQNPEPENIEYLDTVERETPSFFTGESMMPIGAYYYPEHWSPDQWRRDLEKMADLGFEFTHFGEFAWAMLEPEEGKFDFAWLDSCVAIADELGMKIIMCTPTPTPPAWLTHNYPEVLLENEEGIKQRHGTRLHINGMNETYQYFAARIIREMADRYGNDDRIWGWQIDNEPHFGTLYDYSPTAQSHFRSWLKEKYGTIDQLNTAWGTPFWSQVYNHFDQIRIPNKKEAASGANPHAMLDFNRFTAVEISRFLRYQANILKENISSNQWITTNYAYYKFLPPVNPFLNREDLDFASHTMYLLSTFLNYPEGDLAHRLGSGMELSFSNELANSVNGYTGIMELQPGQINWGEYNSKPLPGAVRMWIWHSFALGDEFVCAYRFRQPIYGGEHYHKGILEPDGLTVSPGGEEYVKALNEIKKLKQYYNPDVSTPSDYLGRHTAFLWKQDNLWNMENAKHTQQWDTWQHYYDYYEILKSMGSPVTFITEDQAFDPEKYPYMVAPAYEMVNTEVLQKWKQYVNDGGHLILSCRSGMKNESGQLWEKLLQKPIWDLIGAKVEYYDHLPPARNATVKMSGEKFEWTVWGDVLTPFEGTEVLATHDEHFYKGKPTVVRNNIGQGSVTYIGTWSDKGALEEITMRNLYKQNGTPVLDQDRYVFTEWRDGFWITVNYSSETIKAPVHKNARIIIGDKHVEPGQVCVWMFQ